MITDGTRVVEVHLVRGNLHSEGLLMVYLPKERMVIQADNYSPRPADAKQLPWSPHTANFYENIQPLETGCRATGPRPWRHGSDRKLVAAAKLPH